MSQPARLALTYVAAFCIAATSLACGTLCAQTASPAQQTAAANQNVSPEEARARQDWHLAIGQVPLPKKGCFKADYPSKEWQEVPCVPTPNRPLLPAPPRHGPRPLVVGNNNDVSAKAPSGFISTAYGTFDSTSGITSETGPIGNAGANLADTFSLQINTNFFNNNICNNAAVPANCSVWEQFVYENNSGFHAAYIQYWIIQYNTTCPTGQSWIQIPLYGGIYCYKNNTLGAVSAPSQQPITNLANLALTGNVTSTTDQVTMHVGSSAYARAGDNAVNAGNGWTFAEFNVFGDGGNSAGGGTATFAGTPTVVPRTRIIYGGTSPPTCSAQGFTAEKNNLSFGPTAPASTGAGPAVFFTESSGGGSSNCASAATIGDTHLATFNGLFYDFQAAGDFVLLQAANGFQVHTRQVSGAPTWPNADVNHAVAMQMGKDRVAVCLAPARLNVNGKDTVLDMGQSFSTPDGVDIWRTGNTYTITDQDGDSVRAEVNPTWINVSVGLGTWPQQISGLLANVNNDVHAVSVRGGASFNLPGSFSELYQRLGASWRARPEESLLSVCGGERIETGFASAPFFANNLDKDTRDKALGVCQTAGVQGQAYLDACTLDVAVLGTPDAARVYLTLPQPVAVGNSTDAGGGTGGFGGLTNGGVLHWILWLVIILIILFLFWLLLRKKNP